MAVSATVTPGVVLSENEEVTISKLNALGTPTVDVSGAVGTLSLAAGSVTNTEVATSAAIQHDKLAALSTGQLIVGNAGTPTATTVSGDVTIAADGAVTIANNAVNAAKLADGAVDGAAIAMGSDAQGDILYYNGTSYVRLEAGTDGQFLKTQGAAANPVWASPADADTSGLSFQFETSGTGTFTVPSGVTKVLVQAQGGGSGAYGAHDGVGGGYFEKSLTVAPDDVITYTVGAAGSNGPYNNHSGVSAGGDSTVTLENGDVFTAGGGPLTSYGGSRSSSTNAGLATGDISITVLAQASMGTYSGLGVGGIALSDGGTTNSTSPYTPTGGFVKFIY